MLTFQRETERLWNFASNNDLFTFRTVGDVLDENQKLKDEVKWLNDVITNNISQIMNTLGEHAADISELETEMDDLTNSLSGLPLGTILSWTPYPDRDTQHPVEVPPEWVLCDGAEITEGIWAGHTTPNLNGEKRFLRGGAVADALNMEDGAVQSLTTKDWYFWVHGCASGGHTVGRSDCGTDCQENPDYYCERTVNIDGADGTETKPINMNVVFIMKIK